jgi:hypothetical protein
MIGNGKYIEGIPVDLIATLIFLFIQKVNFFTVLAYIFFGIELTFFID